MSRFVTFVTATIRLRTLAVWAGVTAGTLGVALLTRPVVAARPDATFVAVLTWGCAASGQLAAIAVWVVASDVARSVLVGHPRRRAVGPLHGLLLLACGVAVLGGPGAQAAPVPDDPEVATTSTERDGRRVLDGLPLPDRPGGGHRTSPPSAAREVTVRPGDSLWAIAEAHLDDRATVGEIAAHVRDLHRHNRAVVGTDPDLILPGQRLTLPPTPGRDPR